MELTAHGIRGVERRAAHAACGGWEESSREIKIRERRFALGKWRECAHGRRKKK